MAEAHRLRLGPAPTLDLNRQPVLNADIPSMSRTCVPGTKRDSYSWSAVDPSRPWEPLRANANAVGISVHSRVTGRNLHVAWTDVLDVRVEGVAGLWGLRMAVVITRKQQPPLRFLCPRLLLLSYPHDLTVDIANEIRQYQHAP